MNIRQKLIWSSCLLLGISAAYGAAANSEVGVPEVLQDKSVIKLYDSPALGSENPSFPETTFGKGNDATTINVSDPTLTVYLPEKPNGTSMIMCPGGAFLGLGMISEGENPARELNKHGITVFVLKYRLSPLVQDNGTAPSNQIEMGLTMLKRLEEASAKWSASNNGEKPNVTQICSQLPNWEYAFTDANKAIELVRENASKWGLKTNKIGIMGFSAGGITSVHQAMSHTQKGKPDFAAAIYGGWTDDIKAPSDACPLWMCSPVNDLLDPQESYLVYRAWRDSKVPTELHTFWSSEHGFGVKRTGKSVDNWSGLLVQFMRDVKFLD